MRDLFEEQDELTADEAADSAWGELKATTTAAGKGVPAPRVEEREAEEEGEEEEDGDHEREDLREAGVDVLAEVDGPCACALIQKEGGVLALLKKSKRKCVPKGTILHTVKAGKLTESPDGVAVWQPTRHLRVIYGNEVVKLGKLLDKVPVESLEGAKLKKGGKLSSLKGAPRPDMA